MRYVDTDKLKDIKFNSISNDKYGIYRMGWNDAIDAVVDNEPTADVRKNVRGEWKCNIEWGYGTCSVCGRMFPIRNGNPKADRYNFCPNCGAQMEKEKA